MEQKTKITAEDGKQDLLITRHFDLPVELLFRAHTEPDIVEQWMGSKAIKLEARKHGDWQLEKKDDEGNVLFGASGVFHDFVPNQKITRTFEMVNSPFDVKLEFLEFDRLTDDTCKLTMQIVYRSVDLRDQMLKLPFATGLNMAHDRLQDILNKLKITYHEEKR
jgi:uncharacterized protein YndB with AHSA1/START domain